jgi:hypothetical protein
MYAVESCTKWIVGTANQQPAGCCGSSNSHAAKVQQLAGNTFLQEVGSCSRKLPAVLTQEACCVLPHHITSSSKEPQCFKHSKSAAALTLR